MQEIRTEIINTEKKKIISNIKYIYIKPVCTKITADRYTSPVDKTNGDY